MRRINHRFEETNGKLLPRLVVQFVHHGILLWKRTIAVGFALDEIGHQGEVVDVFEFPNAGIEVEEEVICCLIIEQEALMTVSKKCAVLAEFQPELFSRAVGDIASRGEVVKTGIGGYIKGLHKVLTI